MQKKTKIMDLDKSPTTTIDVDGEQLEKINNFVYLGSRIDADGKSSPDTRRRIAIAISKLNTMEPLWKSQSTELKWRTNFTLILQLNLGETGTKALKIIVIVLFNLANSGESLIHVGVFGSMAELSFST